MAMDWALPLSLVVLWSWFFFPLYLQAMAPKKAPAKPAPGAPPDDDEIDLFQNPITKIPIKFVWMGIGVLTVVCLVILGISVKTYNELLKTDWSPYDEPLKKLRSTLSVGLRNRNVLYYQNPLKVSAIVEKLPTHVKEAEDTYAEEKRKYQALFGKEQKSGANWQLFGWNLYYVSKPHERKTWHDAENFCMSRESHLTSILNEEEQKYISSQFNESAWIGLTDQNEEGHWEWADNSRLIIQYWADGNPNGSTDDGEADEDCTFIESKAGELNWNDASCQELRRWVCKESLDFQGI